MNRTLITIGAAVLAAVPATVGLSGNASFAQSVPVRVPSLVAGADDKGGQTRRAEPGDDKGSQRTEATTATPATGARAADDRGGRRKHVERGDDKGGQRTEATTATPATGTRAADDRGGRRKHVGPRDDKGAHGRDDGPGHS